VFLSADIHARGQASMKVDITGNFTQDVGAKYDGKNWTPVKSFSGNVTPHVTDVMASVQDVGATFALPVRFTLTLYNNPFPIPFTPLSNCSLPGLLSGLYISLEPFIEASAEPGQWNEWTVTGGVESNFGVQLKILWWDIGPSVEFQLFRWETDLFKYIISSNACAQLAQEHGWPSYLCADNPTAVTQCGEEGYHTPD